MSIIEYWRNQATAIIQERIHHNRNVLTESDKDAIEAIVRLIRESYNDGWTSGNYVGRKVGMTAQMKKELES